jgi:predicted  nucleic acid-binding Zn-ribbon protein
LCTAISFTGIHAQKPILLQKDSLKIGSSSFPGISVLIPEIEYTKTLNNWIRLQESRTRSKVVNESGRMSIFGANIKSVSGSPVNIFSQIFNRDTILKLTAVIEMQKDVYIEKQTDEAQFEKAKSFIFDFAKDQYAGLVNEQLRAEKKRLKDLQKELRSHQKDQSGAEKKISTLNKRISSEKDKLFTVNNELITLTSDIYRHNLQIDSLESGLARDEKKQIVTDLEKQKKKASREVRKSEKVISRAERSISAANSAIRMSGTTQDIVRRRISDQEMVVRQYYDKLRRVKAFR